MNPDIKRHLISILITFAAAFTVTFGTALTGLIGSPFTADILISLVAGASVAGMREVFKLLNEIYIKTS